MKKWLRNYVLSNRRANQTVQEIICLSDGTKLLQPLKCTCCKASRYDEFLSTALEFVINYTDSPDQSIERLVRKTNFILSKIYSRMSEPTIDDLGALIEPTLPFTETRKMIETVMSAMKKGWSKFF